MYEWRLAERIGEIYLKNAILSKTELRFLLSSQCGTKPAGLQQQIKRIFDGSYHHIGVEKKSTAAAFFAHDTDGKISHIGHLNIIETIADGDHTARKFLGFLRLDSAHFCGGEGQHLKGKTLAFLGSGTVGIGGDNVDGQISGKLCQSGTDAVDNIAILGDGAVVIQNEVT